MDLPHVTSYASFNGPPTPLESMLSATGHPFTYTGVSPPVSLTSTYNFPLSHDQFHTPSHPHTYYYARSQNPNFNFLSEQLKALHGGDDCVVFASGMGAISATLFSLLSKNRKIKIVYSDEMYHDGTDLLEEMKELCNISILSVDILNTNDVIEKASQEDVVALFFETSSNPNNKVPDIDAIVHGVRARNPNCMFVVDNTFLSPMLFRPFEHGIDIVIESGTKYLSGKGDALLGAVIVKFRSNFYGPQHTAKRLQRWRSMTGGSPSPMSCWLISKGLETLHLRMDHVAKTALEVAEFLETIPCVTRVMFAGLKSHPCNEHAVKYFKSPQKCGGVLRFHIPINMFSEQDVHPFVLAVSFGEAHTLVCIPYDGYSHVLSGDENRGIPKLPGYWVRLAIGLQPAEEIKKGLIHLFARKNLFHEVIGEVASVDGQHATPDPKSKSKKSNIPPSHPSSTSISVSPPIPTPISSEPINNNNVSTLPNSPSATITTTSTPTDSDTTPSHSPSPSPSANPASPVPPTTSSTSHENKDAVDTHSPTSSTSIASSPSSSSIPAPSSSSIPAPSSIISSPVSSSSSPSNSSLDTNDKSHQLVVKTAPNAVVKFAQSETKNVIFVDVLEVQQATKEKKEKSKKLFGIIGSSKGTKVTNDKWLVKVKTSSSLKQNLSSLENYSIRRLLPASHLHSIQYPK